MENQPVADQTASGLGAHVIGIDGGGTKTIAWLARRIAPDEFVLCGEGLSGPGNPRAVGFDQALKNLELAVQAAFAQAQLQPERVSAACLALAGAGRECDRARVLEWAVAAGLAREVQVVNDAEPLLAAGTARGWGIALIAGTGSLAYGKNSDGDVSRVGGWGYLFGDEGSAYAVATGGLRAAAQAADGRAAQTELLPRFLTHFGGGQPQRLVEVVYQESVDRRAIARLALVVLKAAEDGDLVAAELLKKAATDLAQMVDVLMRRLRLTPHSLPLALAGSWMLGASLLQNLFLAELRQRGIGPQIERVPQPVRGSLLLASRMAAS